MVDRRLYFFRQLSKWQCVRKKELAPFLPVFWKVYHYVCDLKSRQGFVFLCEQTHQSQSDEGGDGIETRVCIHRTRANHKGRDAPAAPPLLLDRACAQRSSPLVGDRWVAESCFTKHKVLSIFTNLQQSTATLTLHLFFFSQKWSDKQLNTPSDSTPQLET